MSSADFVVHVVEQRHFLLLDQLGDALDQLGLLHLIRHLGDHDLVHAARAVFLVPFGANAERAAAGFVGFGHRLGFFDDDPAGREIRALDEFEQGGVARVGILDQCNGRGAEFAQIVRRDGGRHAHGDAVGTIRQQIGEAGRKDDGFFLGAVIGVAKIDGVLVQPLKQCLSNFR